MSNNANKLYAQRLMRVIDYIYDHIDEDLSVEVLSQVAHFSKFHFHRQFTNYAGITVFKLVQLIRLRKAAFQLVNTKNSILDIALEAKFENPESFSRALKRHLYRRRHNFGSCQSSSPGWLNSVSRPIEVNMI